MPDAGDKLKAALEYAARGWAVLPCHSPCNGGCSCGAADCGSPGKHPRTPSGLKDATTDGATIREWWQRWPDANVGVLTGRASVLVVVDADDKPNANGCQTLYEWNKANSPHLPITPAEKTGGGGVHYLFAYPDCADLVPSKVGVGPGVDIRADGGYIVAAPSVHASGRPYEWMQGQSPSDIDPPTMPEWLLRKIIGEPRAKRATRPASSVPSGAEDRQTAL